MKKSWVEYKLADGNSISKQVEHNINDIKKNIPLTKDGTPEKLKGFITYLKSEKGEISSLKKYYVATLCGNGFSIYLDTTNCKYENPDKKLVNVIHPETFKLVPMGFLKITTHDFENKIFVPFSADIEHCAKSEELKPYLSGYNCKGRKATFYYTTEDKNGLAKENEEEYYIGYLSKGTYIVYTNKQGMPLTEPGVYKVFNPVEHKIYKTKIEDNEKE